MNLGIIAGPGSFSGIVNGTHLGGTVNAIYN